MNELGKLRHQLEISGRIQTSTHEEEEDDDDSDNCDECLEQVSRSTASGRALCRSPAV
jgi:hypothetical protein